MTQTPMIPAEFTELTLSTWLNTSAVALTAVASFRRQVMLWQDAGAIDNSGLLHELQKLDDSGLSSYGVRIIADMALVLAIPARLPAKRIGGGDA